MTMRVVIEAISFSKRECFYEDVVVKGTDVNMTNAVLKAIKKFDRKHKGQSIAVISAKLDIDDIVW